MKTIMKVVYATPIAFMLAWFSPFTDAAGLNPPPDGGYPGGNTAEGQSALLSLTSGSFNTAVGFSSLRSNTTGSFNTANGGGALFSNTTGTNNTANGIGALLSNTTGSANTATGNFALASNTADGNTATGASALVSNTTGNNNTATGDHALASNTTISVSVGAFNTATGSQALFNNTIGEDNTANGYQALHANTTGTGNTADGSGALFSTTGYFNTAIGISALVTNTTGSHNTALGELAGINVTTAENVICIRAGGANVSNSCYIGNIFGQTSFEGVGVFVNSDGKLGTSLSSRRFKNEIQPMDKTSEAILALRPVTFHYKSDKAGTPQFGLIAEEVAEVNPDLVVRDENGEIYTVRYDAVNAMLLNEFLKEHEAFLEEQRKVQKLEANAARQQKQIEALIAGLQKVSAQVERNRTAPRSVASNQ